MYRELAGTYDRIYGEKNYDAESARLIELITDHNPGAQTLLDVACGTGGHLVHLQSKFECEGVDLSQKMIELAQEKLPGMSFHVSDMTEFDLGKRFDAVVCLFSAVGHLKTTDRLNTAVARMASHLEPGGLLAIEPWADPADWLVGRVSLDTFEDEEMTVARMSVAEPVDRGRLVLEFLVGTKAGVSRISDEHEMGWFTRAEYEAAFLQAGLSVRFEAEGLTQRGLYIGISSV